MTTADAIFILGLLFMSIGLMSIAWTFKKPPFAFGAIGGWILLAVFTYGLSAGPWDIYYGMFWFSIGLMIVSALESMTLTNRTEEPPIEEKKDRIDRYLDRVEAMQERQARYRRALGGETTEERRERKKQETLRR